MSSVVNFVGSQFSVQVRPLDPAEMSATCPIAVQPRAADNADPLGLWVEAPNWQLQPHDAATPVPLNDPDVLAVVQLITANNGVQPAPPPQARQRGAGRPDRRRRARSHRLGDVQRRLESTTGWWRLRPTATPTRRPR